MTAKNSNLSKAKIAKNDEFYTQYHDIEKEMQAYLDFNPDVFKDKTILLPCDDPEWSNFTKYFAQNFQRLGLKKLISTSFAATSKPAGFAYQPSLFELSDERFDPELSPKQGKIFTLTHDKSGDGKINIDDLEWKYLKGDGDFRSDEVKKLRDQADIIITNPPFSLFREFLAWIVEANKQFTIIGNMNAITYKESFLLIKDNKFWLGATNFNQGMYFRVPDNFVYADTYKFEREQGGQKVNRVPGVCWFTNIEHGRRHEPLPLMTMADNLKFNKKIVGTAAYLKYDNYNAIEVPFTNAIPSDFDGVMGVPISFLDKYNPDQFEILGATQRGCHDLVPDTKKYDDYWEMKQNGEKTGSKGGKTNENANLAMNDGKKNYFINQDGHSVQSAYQRIFIKHKR
ncbi:adenine-specific methyltransferase EcoRI family protein [Haemophilus aegyptius]|nr:adenine-specific methyltransferase EcoRI family protein [Haemophilus aegyptius]OBX78443.1 DNA methyltransferase [Haemophilus aegyptius]STO61211.1 adenine-specific methyltransferase [Haemophilus aegyptius]